MLYYSKPLWNYPVVGLIILIYIMVPVYAISRNTVHIEISCFPKLFWKPEKKMKKLSSTLSLE